MKGKCNCSFEIIGEGIDSIYSTRLCHECAVEMEKKLKIEIKPEETDEG